MNLPILNEKIVDMNNAGVNENISKKLFEYIESETILSLSRIAPYRLADKWKLDRYDVLNAFLFATRFGITDLQWNIKCDSCFGPPQGKVTHRLLDLDTKGYCSTCQIETTGRFDESVEITFKVNSAVRDASAISNVEAVHGQMAFKNRMTFNAEPKNSQIVQLNLEAGRYYMANQTFAAAAVLVVSGEAATEERHVIFDYSGKKFTPGTQKVNPGPIKLEIINSTDEEMELWWGQGVQFPWVSAAAVTTNQHFRDLFDAELIRPDASFSISNLVLLFTDIKGSTSMYERLGDAKAYALVRDHFDILTKIVMKYKGAVVKTIGDAVMASFLNTEDAVKASLEMHDEFATFNSKDLNRDDVIIKVGLHKGPTIAVTSNGRLDYFGRTVNTAARVQGLSGGDDVMLSAQLFSEKGISELVALRKWNAKPMQASLKGIEGMFNLVHLTR